MSNYENKRRRNSSDADDDDDVEDSSKRFRRSDGGGRSHKLHDPQRHFRFLIPNKFAGGVIGKAGANAKRLREEYNVKVQVLVSDGPERVVVIDLNGTKEETDLSKLFTDLLEKFEEDRETYRNDANQMGLGDIMRSPELRCLVHESQAGVIIGKSGSNVKKIRETSGLKNITVHGTVCPSSTDRVVLLAGDIEKIVETLLSIFANLEDCPPKGPSVEYDPRNFDDSIAKNYGGFGAGRCDFKDSGGRRGFRIGGGRRDDDSSLFGGRMFEQVGRLQASLRGRDMGLRNMSGGFGGSFGNGRHPFGMMGMRDGPSRMFSSELDDFLSGGNRRGFGGGFGGGFDMFANSGGKREEEQVKIPAEYAGAIIGPGGSRIKMVKAETGAEVLLDRNDGTKCAERVVTISGTLDQIRQAKVLLQLCIKKYGR